MITDLVLLERRRLMDIKEITLKKENKEELNKEEIHYFIENYTNGNLKDEDVERLVRAIYNNGMSDDEVVNLTLEMAHSGEVLDLSELGDVIDKHSTGGVGDKTSLILLPIISAIGVPIAKMSGRGLGFTGGTVDKEESIPGYKTSLSVQEFIDNVKNIGICMIGQTANLAPADKKIYALRNKIGCTDSIPLIASSIMSKKIASGANKIVIDVTYGSGAFMKTEEDARKLADEMEKIGKLVNKETKCVITSMEQPLGFAIGNNLEVIEAINSLNGNIPEDALDIVVKLGVEMLKLSGKVSNEETARYLILHAINSKAGLDKFKEMVQNQGGDISYIDDVSKFKKADYIVEVRAEKDGVIRRIEADTLGTVSGYLGAGRKEPDEKIDHDAGIVLQKKVGDVVLKDEILCYIHTNIGGLIDKAKEDIKRAYYIE